MFGTKEFQNFIIALKKYNQKAKRKINFYGIDLEFQKHITQKMQEYLSHEYINTLENHIIKNQENTAKINSLDDKHFEIQREEALVKNFFSVYKPNSICYMGAWHIRENLPNENFAKKIQTQVKNIQLLAIEMLYQNSKRTIQENKAFKTIKINDNFDRTEYHKYGDFYIMKIDKKQGVMTLEDCTNTKMIG